MDKVIKAFCTMLLSFIFTSCASQHEVYAKKHNLLISNNNMTKFSAFSGTFKAFLISQGFPFE